MNEIISISTKEINGAEVNSVNAKEIYEYLGVKTRFDKWIQRAITKYDFRENIDFEAIDQKRPTAQGNTTTYKDYIVTIDMAKELAMLENNPKGREARKYFLNIEKEFHITVDKINILREEALALQKEKQSNENLVMKLANLSLCSQKRDIGKYLQVYALRQRELPNPMIAGALGMSVSAVENYASKLIQMGFIERN